MVAELRKATHVVLLVASGPYDPDRPNSDWQCDAWRVAHSDFTCANCALLWDPNAIFVINTSSSMHKPNGRVPAVTFTARGP